MELYNEKREELADPQNLIEDPVSFYRNSDFYTRINENTTIGKANDPDTENRVNDNIYSSGTDSGTESGGGSLSNSLNDDSDSESEISLSFGRLLSDRLEELNRGDAKYNLYEDKVFHFVEWIEIPNEEKYGEYAGKQVVKATMNGKTYIITFNEDSMTPKLENGEQFTEDDYDIYSLSDPQESINEWVCGQTTDVEDDEDENKNNGGSTGLILGVMGLLGLLFWRKK